MMPGVEKFKALSRPVKYLICAAAGTVAFLIFTMLILPAVIRAFAVSQLSKTLSRKAAIESVFFNPFNLSIEVKGFAIHEPNADRVFVSFNLLRVDAEIASMFKGGAVIKEIRLVRPYVNLVRKDANVYNMSDLLAGKKEETPAPQKKPFLFSLGNIQIVDGAVDFDDMPKHAGHRITAISLAVPLVSNFNYCVDAFVYPLFSARVNGKPFELTGKVKPFAETRETQVEINLQDINLSEYIPYVPADLSFKVPSGRFSTKLLIDFAQHAREKPEIKIHGAAGISELQVVSRDNKQILALPSFSLNGIFCNVGKQELSFDEISFRGLDVHIARGKDGSLSLQKLVAKGRVNEAAAPEKKDAPAGPAWSVKVKKLAFADAAVHAEDNSTSQPVVIAAEKMNFKVDNLSTDNSSRADVDFSCIINAAGSVRLQGWCMLNPFALSLNLDLADIDLRPAQGYVPDAVKLAITGGSLAVKGALELKKDKEKMLAGYQGDIGLYNFAAATKKHADDLLTFKALDIKGIRAGSAPLSLDIGAIKLSGLTARLIVEQDGSMNLAAITENPEPSPDNEITKKTVSSAPEKSEKPSLQHLRIGSFMLDNGRVQFTDKTIKPRYSAELSDIKGKISGISSRKEDAAHVQISAKLNRYAPLTIAGSISPLQEKRNADIKIMFSDIDLSAFSSYSGRFAGRAIEKGKLSLDLAYLIKDNQLAAQNRVFLDQLTFGGRVESKQATGLPVGLAVSLLKNRKGEIHLDLPVSGSLDDPQFSVTKVLFLTLLNIVEKAAISPFSLISAVIPGGEDLSRIAFDCGSALIPEKEAKKLGALVDLLSEKADLKLEIQGQADAEKDREGLWETMLLRKLKALKLKELAGKGRAPDSIDEVEIEKDEYESYLSKAYRAEKFPKPGILGIPKMLPAEKMKKLMLEHIAVTDEDMRQMMEQRAIAVKNHIADSGKVQQERLFIVAPKISSGTGQAGCCVEFKLK